MREIEITCGENSFTAEVAETIFQRMKGLSFRGNGKMLFVFARDTAAKIDMMFLSEPLYLYFMDENRKIFEVQKAEPWTKNPRTWKLYSPERPYRYLLESFEPLDVEEGDSLKFDL